MKKEGTLYICPTPIGNLDDITIRALNTLKKVDLIAAEDTRRTVKLLNHFNIKCSLTSYHEHNAKEKGEFLINKLLKGVDIALVSDAGMPGISDPGEDLVKLAVENEIDIEALPGPTASILALVASGLSTNKFVFEGFLDSKKKKRRQRITELNTELRTIIFYESPYRLIGLLKDINNILGDRKIAVAKELTKRFEKIYRGNVSQVLKKLNKEKIKGEFVVVVSGIDKEKIKQIDKDMWNSMTIREHIELYISKGFSKKDAVKKVSKERELPKREVYKESIKIEMK